MMSRQIVLITGASRGIGAATARLLASQGINLCLNYRSDSVAAQAVLEDVRAMGVDAIAVQADVSKEAEVVGLFSTLDQQLGRLTGLVNNAGILQPQMRLEAMTAERINHILTTNVTSQFLCCREAVKRMAFSHGGKGGAIVNVSSAASRSGAPFEYIDYAASKGAVDSLTKGLSLEVASDGIRVNGVRPGFIATEMHADGGEPERVARLIKNNAIPMQRGGSADEVAEAISWLLSDKASYSTGSFIDLAGGR